MVRQDGRPSSAALYKIPGVSYRDMLEAWHNRRGYSMAVPPDLATLRLEDFAGHLDAIFEMRTSGGVVPLKLVEAVAGGHSPRAGGAFSLVFVASAGSWLPQASYAIRHPTQGMMEIFLVPIGPASGGNGYQAIFA
jgi:hypothetical protein